MKARLTICLFLAAGTIKTYSIGAAINTYSPTPPHAAPSFTHNSEESIIRRAAERNGIEYGSDDWYLLLSIRRAENGGKGKEFGIMNPKANTLELQAAWCAATIMKNHKRFGSSKVNEDFIKFLGSRYAPIGINNDPKNLNANWVRNVTAIFRGFKETQHGSDTGTNSSGNNIHGD